MSVTKDEMADRLRQPQALESLNIERIITAQVDDCRRMSMLSALMGDPSFYWQSVQTLKTLMAMIADEDYLKETKEIDEEMKATRERLSQMWEQRPYEHLALNLEHFANKYFTACMRRLQRMGLGLTLIGEDETFQ
jgi:hypothetical protein